jgi:D-3-phosphoglycerate dehydrogenase / 2-oxoglutarate reductase
LTRRLVLICSTEAQGRKPEISWNDREFLLDQHATILAWKTGYMTKLKVVVSDYIEPNLDWESEQFAQMGVDFSTYQLKKAPTPEILNVIADADVVIVNMAPMNEEVLNGLNRTKLIIRHGVGYDNIDVPTASRRGIVVSYMPDYCMNEVAEQAVMLIMACQRKLSQQIHLTEESSRSGKWIFEPVYPVYSLRGKTLGIIGCGRIGSLVHTMMQNFGLKRILICDPYLTEERRSELGSPFLPLNELLNESDIVTIHTPLGRETFHLLDEPQFKQMKTTAILVNTARGGIVNLDALDRALKNGQPGFAGIDVYEHEPPEEHLAILKNKKAICTPHLAWLSEESGWNIRKQIVEDVDRFMRHEGPKHPIDRLVPIRFE